MEKESAQIILLLKQQNQQLLHQVSELSTQNKKLLEQLTQQNAQLQEQNSLISKMQGQLDELLRARFGKKSERKKPPEKNKSAEGRTPKEPGDENKAKRKRLPEHLVREKIYYELPESERGCPHCYQLCHCIGKEVTEQLEFIPARLYVKAHVRYKYACKYGCTLKMAPLPAQPIDKGIAGPGLLADVLVSKYQDHLPLYRQALRFKRHGVELSESTLCDWVAAGADLLARIASGVKEELLLNNKLHTDDTIVPVLAPGKAKQGRLWVYVADHTQTQAATVYDYTPTRSQKGPVEFLKGYKGYLQVDGYSGYDILFKDGRMTRINCLAHARRKFFDVSLSTKNDNTADQALVLIGKIYEVERIAKNMTVDERYFYRKKHSKKLYHKFYRWLKTTKKKVLPRMPQAKAINYTLNHWRELQNVLADGRLLVDNNTAERAIKPVVIGRKNYLFAGSDEGAKRAAIIYSIIETCKQNNINTFEYLKDVLTRLPTQLNSKLDELLPYRWRPPKN